MPEPRSLHARFPRHVEVPALILAAVGALVVALLLPFMRIDKFGWDDDYTLLTSIKGLWSGGQAFIAILIFFFSIVFPYAKLGMLVWIWYRRVDPELRGKLLFWLGVLGKWSMLDVFVVALLIVMTQSKAFIDASPRWGLYIFALAIALSIIVSLRVEWLANRAEDHEATEHAGGAR
jgi:paraquat-inducible protein A